MSNRVAGLLLLALAGFGHAQERFYPVVGPDGKVRMIKGESAQSAPAPAAAPAKPAEAVEVPAPVAGGAAAAEEPKESSDQPEASRTQAAPAPYDSEEFTDVEDIEGRVGEAAPPERFYLIRDGSGQHVTTSGGEGEQAPPEPVAVVPKPAERFSPLPSLLQVDDEVSDAERPEGVPACLPADDLDEAKTAVPGDPVTVVVDRRSHVFMGPGKVAAVVRLGESGIRTLVTRSYSAKDRNPAFLDPELFFLDAKGCMVRRVSGLFERRYGPTPSRHPMLRGELLVHADEEYVLVVAATGSRRPVADSPFPVSSRGQLSFSIKK